MYSNSFYTFLHILHYYYCDYHYYHYYHYYSIIPKVGLRSNWMNFCLESPRKVETCFECRSFICTHCCTNHGPPAISPGPPHCPLSPREWEGVDLAPFLTVSCLTAIWRPSSRYWPVRARLRLRELGCLASGAWEVLLPLPTLSPKRWLARSHAHFSLLLPGLVFTQPQTRHGGGEKLIKVEFGWWIDF